MNYGHTTIVVHGPERDRDGLREQLAATARGALDFTLVAAAPEFWKRDDHMCDATMESTDGMLVLRTCLLRDEDALPLCGSLARRHRGLRFDGFFECELTSPEFTVTSHSNGVEEYRVHFEVPFVTHLRGERLDAPGLRLAFYLKDPERDTVAPDRLVPSMAPLLAVRPVAGGWRRGDDHAACACYLRAREDGSVTALVLEPLSGEGHVLSGVDAYGGYRHSETLEFADLHRKFPELSGELARTSAAARAEQTSAASARRPYDADMPF